jgi:hypothetical protein
MMQSRRAFGKQLFTFFAMLSVLGRTFTLAGCTGSIWSQILTWIPVGEASLNSILSVLTANGVLVAPGLQAIVSLIEAGFTALTAAIKEYQATTPPPVGVLAKIETAFADIVNNFKTFLASLNVNGGLLSIIVGIAQVVLSTIAAFMGQLPAASSLRRTVLLGDSFRVGVGMGTIVPKSRTRGQFKRDVNTVLGESASVGVVCPHSAYLPLTFWEKF